MKSNSMLLARCLLVVVLAASMGCGQKKPGPNELVGEWLGRTVTTKLAGRADETKTYSAREFVMTFSADGTFVDLDRGVPGETITISGSYEITQDHKLKEKILDATGSKFAAMLKGRTVLMDFKVVAPDQLTILVQLDDKDGKKMGTTESTFVRAPK
jgi:hypothetical protein